MSASFFLSWLEKNQLLAMAGLVFVLIFAVFFPSLYAAIDEHEYAKNALLIAQRKLNTVDPLDYCGGTIINGKNVSSYVVGRSFSMLPFLPFGLEGFLASGLLIHLLNLVLFVLILQRLKLDSRFGLLYLLFPAFVWNARTLYPELLVLSAVFCGIFFYLGNRRREWMLSGFFFGLAVLVRYDAALLSAGFFVVSFLKRREQFGWLLAGFSAMGLLVLWLNTVLYGGSFNTPYGSSAVDVVTKESNPLFWTNLALLVIILLLAYPLMLLSPFAGKKLSWEALIGALLLMILFAQKSNISVFDFFSPLTFTSRMRYLIPAAGLLLIPYSDSLQRLIERLHHRFSWASLKHFFWLVGSILLLAAVVLSAVHSDFLQKRSAVRTQLEQYVPEGSLVVGSSDDCIYFLKDFFGDRQYVKVNESGMNIPQLIQQSQRPVFIMQLRYSNKSDSVVRQEVIDKDRNHMDSFIQQNAAKLVPIFSTQSPHTLRIFKYVP